MLFVEVMTKILVISLCLMAGSALFILAVLNKKGRRHMVSEKVKGVDLKGRMFTCPVQGKRSTFQLVDEFDDGKPYAGLAYEAVDFEGFKYNGFLDSSGTGEVINHFAGPIALTMLSSYQGVDDRYGGLMARQHYPLKITELQVRAEQTRYFNKDGSRTSNNPALLLANTDFYQIEVRHLVEHVSHLPPVVACHYPPSEGARQLMVRHSPRGVCMLGSRHSILQVRPLRALRPMFSTDPQFCALNLYQLSLMATLSYCPFGQAPNQHPIHEASVSFKQVPSSGNWFGDALAKYRQLWRVDAGQVQAYYPLYEDVAYSRRFEIVPFDPALYPINQPQQGPDQESPAKIHFLDDRGDVIDTDTQAFATHSDEIILIAIRGTSEGVPDALRDADAFQVPFEEGEGAVHRGFYGAAKQAYEFATKYLDKFHAGQKILICGHSLGGAIALILSEMLRRRPGFTYDILLHTYGSPRAGDATFVKAAESLVHHRMVNHNDPVPSVPAPWMKVKPGDPMPGFGIRFLQVPAQFAAYVTSMVNVGGEAYMHHGQLQHFMPVDFDDGEVSHILWAPGCETLAQHAACTLAIAQHDGLPARGSFIQQVMDAGNHSMTGSYVPHCWATLRRWQEAQANNRPRVTGRELEWVDEMLSRVEKQVKDKVGEMIHQPLPRALITVRAIDSLLEEAAKMKMTRDRLRTLSYNVVQPTDVYGNRTADAEGLAESIERWQANSDSTRVEQLAMAPKGLSMAELDASLGLHVVGAPYLGDILDLP